MASKNIWNNIGTRAGQSDRFLEDHGSRTLPGMEVFRSAPARASLSPLPSLFKMRLTRQKKGENMGFVSKE